MRRVKERGATPGTLRPLQGTAAASDSPWRASSTAIDARQFVVYYQPQIDVSRKDVVVGLEALVRWQHPTRGLLPPVEFITLAEEIGLIVPLGEQVLRMGVRRGTTWQMPDGRPLPVAVNVSGRQLRDSCLWTPSLASWRDGLESGLLEIELTETATLGEGGQLRESPARASRNGHRNRA